MDYLIEIVKYGLSMDLLECDIIRTFSGFEKSRCLILIKRCLVWLFGQGITFRLLQILPTNIFGVDRNRELAMTVRVPGDTQT